MHDYPRKPRRRWLQFSLKTVLIIMIFAAGYFAVVGTAVRRAQRLRQEAISAERAARKAEEQARRQAERARMLAESALMMQRDLQAVQESVRETEK